MYQENERQSGMKDYIRVLYRGKWIIIISFLTVVTFVSYYTFTETPIYRSTVKVMVKDNGGVQKTLFNVTDFMEKEKKINNQVEILNSRTIAENVANKLINSTYANNLIILGNTPDNGKKKFGLKKKLKKIVKSVFVNEEEVTIPESEIKEALFNRVVGEIRRNLKIEPIRNTDMILISMTAESPTEAAYLANTVAVAYKEQNQFESQEEVRKVKDFLKDQLNNFQSQLEKSEQALKEYKEKEKVVALPQEIDEMVSKLAEFESLYHGAKLELNANKERLVYIDEQLDKNKKNINMENILNAPFLDQLSQQMAELETKRANYIAGLMDEGVYDPNGQDPMLRRYEERTKMLEEKYKSEITQLAAAETIDPIALSEALLQRKLEVEATIQSLLPQVEALKKIVAQYNLQLEKIPERGLKLARLKRAAMLDEKITLMMSEKYEETRITEVGQLGSVRIIDAAQPNIIPIRPQIKMNIILGIIVGLGLGIGISFLLDYFDNSVRSADEIEKMGISLLGSIPVISLDEAVKKIGKNGNNRFKKNINTNEVRTIAGRLITHFAPKSPISEAYRSLRTSIQYSQADKTIKSIVFTSPGPKEGKSTTVVNLAIAIAQMGTNVLLVDTDLRRPVIHSIFNLNRNKGLSNCLVGKTSIEEAISKTDIDNLCVIPSGTLPPNPSELLGSTKMKKFISELEEQFDLVLFDSPPIMAVTDAAVLSSEVDGVVMVVKEGQTNRDAVMRCYNILKSVPNQLLGAVMNGINVNGFSDYYYYYQYHYYGKEDKKKKRIFRREKV